MKRNGQRVRLSLVVIGAVLAGVLLFPLGAAGLSVPQMTAQSGKLGGKISLTGSIGFGANEARVINSVHLAIASSQPSVAVRQPCDVDLPAAAGAFGPLACTQTGSGTVEGTVTHTNVTRSGNVFTGGPNGGSIGYQMFWRSPVFLTPAPVFTLIPNTASGFPIPEIPTPVAGEGVVDPLPALTEQFGIPKLVPPGQEGLPNPLPALTEAFGVPLIPQPAPPEGVAELPAVAEAFSVPVVPLPTPLAGAPAELPTVTEAWTIPAIPTPGAVAGVPDLPSTTTLFSVPSVTAGTTVVRGTAYDGTDYYLVVNPDFTEGTPTAKIMKVSASGALVTGFGGGDGVIDGPSAQVGGITYASLTVDGVSSTPVILVADNSRPTANNFRNKIFRYRADTGALINSFFTQSGGPVDTVDINGLSTEGDRIWAARADGCTFAKLSSTTGSVVEELQAQCGLGVGGFATTGSGSGIAFYTAGNLTTIKKWVRNPFFSGSVTEDSSYDLASGEIGGLSASISGSRTVLHLGDAESGSVLKAAFPHGVVVEGTPRGLAADPDGTHIWALVDATPKDKLAKIKISDGSLVASYDAPNSNTNAITYMSNFLWIASKSGFESQKIHKVDPANGSETATVTVSQLGDPIGGLANDGSNLFAVTDTGFDQSVYEINETNGNIVRQPFIQDAFSGGRALARKSDGTFFKGKNEQVQEIDAALTKALRTFTTNPALDIQGSAFVGNVLYMADAEGNKVYKASIPLGIVVTQDPLGLAYDGADLWILLDATPLDKIAKVSAANGAFFRALEVPSAGASGVTFLDGHLWVSVVDEQQFQTRILKIDPATGQQVAVLTTIFDRTAGLTNDGTRLVAVNRERNDFYLINRNTGAVETRFPFEGMGNSNGGNALARNPRDGKYMMGKGSQMVQVEGGLQRGVQSFQVNNPELDIQGLTFIDNILYIGDQETDKVYRAAVPTGIQVTQTPLGLAYDGLDLWILIEATPLDKIAKVSTANGAFFRAFEVPSGNASGITYMDGHLWVATQDNFETHVRKISPTTGLQVSEVPLPQEVRFTRLGGLTNDATRLLGANAEFPEFLTINPTTGGTQRFFLEGPGGPGPGGGAQAFAQGAEGEFVFGRSSQITRIEWDRQSNPRQVDQFTTTIPTEIVGMTLVGANPANSSVQVYVADEESEKIYKTAVPGRLSFTQDPLDMAFGGGALWLLLEASPLDKILKMNGTTFALENFFFAPDDDTQGLAFTNGQLYVAVNDDDLPTGFVDRHIRRVDPNTGAAGQRLPNFGSPPGDLAGLGVRPLDGSLLATRVDSDEIMLVDPNSGNVVGGFFSPDVPSGLRDLDTLGGEGIFAAKQDRIFRLDEFNGFLIQQFNAFGFDLDGVAADAETEVLYFADKTSKKVYAATVPVPPTEITKVPKGMATNGTDLFIVVDASPRDRIIKVNTSGQLVTAFGAGGVAEAPSNNTDAIDYFSGFLWVLTNEEFQQFGGRESRLVKLDPATGEQVSSQRLPDNVAGEAPFNALANDGQRLIAGQGGFGSGAWYLIDPSNVNAAQRVNQNPQQFPFMERFESMVYISVADLRLWGVNGTQFNQFDRNSGQTLRAEQLQGVQNVTGLAYIGTTLYLADRQLEAVRRATFLANRPEITAAGAYQATLAVNHSGVGAGTIDTSTPASFNLDKATAVDVSITSPTEGAVIVTDVVTVQGVVDLSVDPSIRQVGLGAELARVTLFEDDANDPQNIPDNVTVEGTSQTVKWHVDTSGQSNSAPGAWHYAKDVPGDGNYDTPGQANSGSVIIEGLPIGEGAFFAFHTWYNTEGGVDRDQKLVEINLVGDSPDAGWLALRQILPPLPPGGQPPAPPGNITPHETFQFEFIQPSRVDPQLQPVFTQVAIPLGAFQGETVDIRFKFDTRNPFFNSFQGWYVDDIRAESAGAGGAVTTAVDPDTGAFEFPDVTVEEGRAEISVTAVNPYLFPIVKDTATVGILRDTRNPLVFIDQDLVADPNVPDIITSAETFEITGSIDEINFASLLMTSESDAGVLVPLTLTEAPANDEFSAFVTLVSGLNLVTVLVTDGADRSGTASVLILRDTEGPAVQVLNTVYPVGVVSARKNDPIIVQLNAVDLASDVQCVEVIFGGGPGGQLPEPCAPVEDPETSPVFPFLRPEAIPEAVRDTWGTTGEWLLPLLILEGALPGSLTLPVRAVDLAGNVTQTSVSAVIVPALSAVNIGLMPGANLKGLPLIPDVSGIPVLLGKPRLETTAIGPATMNGYPAVSPECCTIAFASDADGDVDENGFPLFDIYLLDKKTGAFTQITDDAGNNLSPAWSPDGQVLAFVSDRDSADGFFDVFVSNPAGTVQLRLTAGAEGGYDNFDPTFPDGPGNIAYVSDRDADGGTGVFDIWRIRVQPGQSFLTDPLVDEGLRAGTPFPEGVDTSTILGRFSPQIHSRPGGGGVRLFTSDEGGDGTFDLYTQTGTPGNPPVLGPVFRLVDRHLMEPFGGDWSPDGRWVAYVEEGSAANLFAVRANGTDRKQITYGGVRADSAVEWGYDNRVHIGALPDGTGAYHIQIVEPRLFLLTQAIWYYDAGRTSLPVEDRWVYWTPRPGDEDPDTDPATTKNLNILQTGRGYWWLTDQREFVFSAPLDVGLPNTPKVENFSYTGRFLREGAEAPPVYATFAGWNLGGVHSELPIVAEEYLSAMGRGDAAAWSSLLVFDNFIDFPIGVEDAQPRFELGHFTRIFANANLLPTQGFWLFTTRDGFITP